MPGSDPAPLRAPLAALMREAGAIARATAAGPFKRWTKGKDHSPVCEGDIAVNDFLRARLPALAPAAGWLSEETADEPGARAAVTAWIVDPIDGTRAYLAGYPDWTISVALVDAGRPVLAALYAPVSDEMFLALRGQGATRNDAPHRRQRRQCSRRRAAGRAQTQARTHRKPATRRGAGTQNSLARVADRPRRARATRRRFRRQRRP